MGDRQERKEERASHAGTVERDGNEKAVGRAAPKKERNIPVEIYVPKQNSKSMNESNSTDGRNVSQASTENKSEKKNQEDSAADDKKEGDDKRIIEEKLWVANSMPNEEEEISQMLIELQGYVSYKYIQ